MNLVSRFIVRICLLSVMLAVGAGAQGSWPPASGTRVRVTVHDPSREQHVARVIETRGDSVTVEWAADVPYSNVPSRVTLPPVRRVVHISQLEVSNGFNTSGWRGMGFGAVFGLAIGAVVGYAGGDGPLISREQAVALVAPVGLVVGTVVGGLVGSARRKELWRSPPGWSGTGASLTPTFSHRGAGLSVTLRF